MAKNRDFAWLDTYDPRQRGDLSEQAQRGAQLGLVMRYTGWTAVELAAELRRADPLRSPRMPARKILRRLARAKAELERPRRRCECGCRRLLPRSAKHRRRYYDRSCNQRVKRRRRREKAALSGHVHQAP